MTLIAVGDVMSINENNTKASNKLSLGFLNETKKTINVVHPSTDNQSKDQFKRQVRFMIKTAMLLFWDCCKGGLHTFQQKQERVYRVVVDSLHHSTRTALRLRFA